MIFKTEKKLRESENSFGEERQFLEGRLDINDLESFDSVERINIVCQKNRPASSSHFTDGVDVYVDEIPYERIKLFTKVSAIAVNNFDDLDIKLLLDNNNIECLIINNCANIDFTEMEQYGQIKELIIRRQKEDDIKKLPSLPNLGYLQIDSYEEGYDDNIVLANVSFPRLKTLSVSGTYIDLKNLKDAKCLNCLSISGVKIEVPEYFKKLESLNYVSIYNSTLQIMHNISCNNVVRLACTVECEKDWEMINSFSNLESLKIECKTDTINWNVISKFYDLQELEIIGQKTTLLSIPDNALESLKNLRIIEFRNLIINHTSLEKLQSVVQLSIYECTIDSIPDNILLKWNIHNDYYWKNDEYVYIYENIDNFEKRTAKLKRIDFNDEIERIFNIGYSKILLQPISLFGQPKPFLQEYAKQPKITIGEAKVIFLGDGEVGKTTTIRRMLESEEPIGQTPGVEISTYDVHDEGRHYKINLWDFGSQEVMHAMHRCFLTSRTAYVIVLRSRRSETMNRARYWLRNVNSFAKDSPVILAINEEHGNNVNDLDINRLKLEYPNIVDVLNYNAIGHERKDVRRFNELIDTIEEVAGEMDSCKMQLPTQWASVRNELLDLSIDRPYIDISEYLNICNNHGIEDKKICDWLLEWFNDLGVCFSYDQEPGVKDYKVLCPEWITNAIYIIINNGGPRAENGILNRDSIRYILNNPEFSVLQGIKYSELEQEYILSVMHKFNLAYKINNMYEFIPALCDAETPVDLKPVDYTQHICYVMEYDFLPDSVIHRLMINCYNGLNKNKLFRKGLCIEDVINKVVAIIDMGNDDQTLSIDVYSLADNEPHSLLTYLKMNLYEVNKALGLVAKEVIRLFSDGEYYDFKLGAVLDAAKQGRTDIGCQKSDSYVEFPIRQILGNTFGERVIKELPTIINEANQSRATVQQIFINYGEVNFTKGIDPESLRQILTNQMNNESLAIELIQALRENQMDPKISRIADEMDAERKKKKNPIKVLYDYLDTAANTIENTSTIKKTLVTVGPIIMKYAPEVIGKVGEIINLLHP